MKAWISLPCWWWLTVAFFFLSKNAISSSLLPGVIMMNIWVDRCWVSGVTRSRLLWNSTTSVSLLSYLNGLPCKVIHKIMRILPKAESTWGKGRSLRRGRSPGWGGVPERHWDKHFNSAWIFCFSVLFCFVLCLKHRVSLCSPGWPKTWSQPWFLIFWKSNKV